MTNTKINPYRKTYNIEIIDKINENGNTYAKLLHNPAFMGSINVESDEFKINGKDPVIYKKDADYYLVEKDLDYVEVSLNWKKRLNIMQQNLGNAIFRHFIEASTDFEILNYKVTERGSYIDIKAKDLRFLTMNNLEDMTNYTINSNLSVENADESIEIDGLGKIFYQGPNLARTGEVSILFIRNVSKKDEYLRIYIIAGEYAYKYARNALNNLNNIKMYLGSNSLNEVFSDVKKLKGGLLKSNVNTEEELKSKEESTVSNKDSLEANSDLEGERPKQDDKTVESTNLEKNEEPKEVIDEISNSSEDITKKSTSTEEPKDESKIEKKDKEDKSARDIAEISSDIKDSSNNLKETEETQENKDDKNLEAKDSKPLTDKNNINGDLKKAVQMFKNYATEVNGINYIYKVLSDINITELKEVSTQLLREDDFVQIYGIKCLNRSKLMILRSQNLNFNLKEIFNKLQKSYNFTGSGNLFTLNIECDTKDLAEFMEIFLIEIRRSLSKLEKEM